MTNMFVTDTNKFVACVCEQISMQLAQISL